MVGLLTDRLLKAYASPRVLILGISVGIQYLWGNIDDILSIIAYGQYLRSKKGGDVS